MASVTLRPSSIVDDGSIGTWSWSNPGNAASSDNAYATATPSSLFPQTHYLKCTGLGSTIPAGATILGFEIGSEGKTSSTVARDNAVRLVIGGAIQTADQSSATDWPTADGTILRGGPTNLMGTSGLTGADIDANFGFAISVKYVSGSQKTISVDDLWITIYYQDPPVAAAGIASTAAAGSPGITGICNAAGVGSAVSFGASVVMQAPVSPVGIASTAAAGSPILPHPVAAAGIAPTLAFGLATLPPPARPTGIASTAALGSPSIAGRVSGQGIAPTLAFGSPLILHKGALYRENATGFIVRRENPGTGYTLLTEPTTASAWRTLDIYGVTSAWHPSDDPPAQESAAPTVDYSNVTGTKPPADATRNQIYIQSGTPSSPVAGDLWFDTANKTWATWTGSLWQVVSDVTAYKTAASIAGQGAFATLDAITAANIRSYINDAIINGHQLAVGAVSTTRGASGTVLVASGSEVQTSTGYNIPAVANAALRGTAFAILLVCNWRYNVSSAAGYTITRRIKRGASVIAEVSFDAAYGPHQSVMVIDTAFPSTAAFTYSVYAQHNLGWDVNIDSSILILEFRKDG
ncbi:MULTISPECIES: hypothetical protein [unclassified Methylococcus]|uniref:hypothetical protein n=1 Tax=unclassified Methylococcus TaxID=2618889 RepID=UPI003D7DD1BA